MNFNQPLCASSYGNVGFGDCFLDLQKIRGAIQVPRDFQIGLSDLATLQTFLENKVLGVIGVRIFPYGGFETINDGTEEPTFNTTDYGFKYKVRNGFYDWTFRYFSGGIMLQSEIQKNGGSGKSFLFYDDANVLFGYKSGSYLKGIPDTIFEPLPWRPNTGAEAAQLLLRFIFDPIYVNYGNFGYIKQSTFNYRDLTGVQEVDLQLLSLSSNIAKIQPLTKVSGINLEETYGAQLASAARWSARKRSNDANIVITGVSNSTSDKSIAITFDSATISGMAATDAVMLRGTSASDWNTAGISGFEAHEELAIELPGS